MTYFVITEEERQAVLLGLAELALSRPGWEPMLAEIAGKLAGKDLFDSFKRSSALSLSTQGVAK